MARKAHQIFSPETPAEVIKRYIVGGHRITQDALAAALGVSRLSVNQLVNGKRTITAEMALRLSRVLKTSPEFWLDLQRDVDLFEARQALGSELEKLPVLRKGYVGAENQK